MANMFDTIIYGLIALSFLVLVHEYGHFLVARLADVKVITFSLGFGKKLFRFSRGETEYAVSAVPLGGYVKLLGESESDEIKEEEKHRSFANKSPLIRISIAFSGPFFNMLLAFVLFFFIAVFGYTTLSSKVGEVSLGFPAEKAGIKAGDVVTRINGIDIRGYTDIMEAIEKSPLMPLEVKVRRNDQELTFSIMPKEIEDKNIFGDRIRRKVIGISSSSDLIKQSQTLPGAFVYAGERVYFLSKMTLVGIGKLITGSISPRKMLGGPLTIFKEAGKSAKRGFNEFVTFVAFISVSLGLLNILPIPVLDGGHITLCLIEMAIGRKISERTVGIAQNIGLAILVSLMAFAFYFDIERMFDIGKFFGK
jgi:regulator of sigma E protease